jgi:hypothetical protein
MAEYILTALDVTGIQRYIFNSNRLKENVGASELVYRATMRFVFEALPASGHNVADMETGSLDPSKTIEAGNIQAEVVYAAGGNVLILFQNMDQARKLVADLSRRLILEAPGLDLAAAHYQFDWTNKTIGEARSQVLADLEQVKNRRTVSQPLLGLGVTVACQSTGLPAVAIHPDKGDENYPISAQVWAKIEHAEKANDRFKTVIKTDENLWQKILDENYYFPLEFDDFGRSKNEHSYIAVIHADINGMGAQVESVFDECQKLGETNRACITKVRQFSDKVNQATQTALVRTITALVEATQDNNVADTIPLAERKRGKAANAVERYLPFRPLVFGGDDLTFVCDGRLGLSLAVIYLNAFEEAINDSTITASAGISVVKTHYPFARAYQLAEELCGEAKNYVEREAAGLDWHFAASGLLGELEIIREKQYTVDEGGKLYMRPIRLKPANGDWRTWDNVRQTIMAFQGKQWADQHNKVIKLRRALRNGPGGVQQFLTAYDNTDLPKMDHPAVAGLNKTGWISDRCGYFDSIEAMDFYVPLSVETGAV